MRCKGEDCYYFLRRREVGRREGEEQFERQEERAREREKEGRGGGGGKHLMRQEAGRERK